MSEFVLSHLVLVGLIAVFLVLIGLVVFMLGGPHHGLFQKPLYKPIGSVTDQDLYVGSKILSFTGKRGEITLIHMVGVPKEFGGRFDHDEDQFIILWEDGKESFSYRCWFKLKEAKMRQLMEEKDA